LFHNVLIILIKINQIHNFQKKLIKILKDFA